MKYFWAVILQLALIALNAVFACAEIAVISMNESKLNLLEAKGGKDAKTARKLGKLTKDPARFLSTIQVAITLAGFLGSAFAADMFAEPLVKAIMGCGLGIPESVVSPVCVVLITLILAFFNIVLGELVPKRVAMNKTEEVAKGLADILTGVSVVFKPIVFLLSVSTNGILKLLGISPDDNGEDVTEEDIIMMAEVGKEKGNIESDESELIKNIFEFSDLTVGEICTHRKDVDVLYAEDCDLEWEKTIKESNHSYYPVCGETADDVKGVLYTKTYFRLDERNKETALKSAVKPPVFLYETASARKVFEQMKKTHEYFAVVIDEYGGMAGIVTIHDILESIVGKMDDEGDEEEYSIRKLDENLWEINGFAPFDEVEEALGIKIDLEEGVEKETFNGYVCSLMVVLPKDGEKLKLSTKQMDIQVLTVEKQTVTKVRLTLKNPVNK